MTVYWDTAPCILVQVDHHVKGAYSLHHQGDRQAALVNSVCIIGAGHQLTGTLDDTGELGEDRQSKKTTAWPTTAIPPALPLSVYTRPDDGGSKHFWRDGLKTFVFLGWNNEFFILIRRVSVSVHCMFINVNQTNILGREYYYRCGPENYCLLPIETPDLPNLLTSL
jgi:hypothetical protein